MNFKNIKYYFFVLLILIIFSSTNNIYAAEKHGLSYRAIKCPISTYEAQGNTGDDIYWACFDDFVSGNLDTYMISNEDNIDPGTVVLLIIDYTLGPTSEVVAINTYINYNSNYWTPIYESTGVLFNYFDRSLFPKPTRKDSTWSTEMNVKAEGNISVISEDTTNYLPLSNDVELGYVFLKLNDNVSAGQSVSLSFGTAGAKMSDKSKNSLEYTTDNMNLSVYGSESQDASLKTLNIKNGNINYPLTPTLIPGDITNKIYKTVVPNNVTSINIDATVNNEYANILQGGLGNKTLSVGNNTFSITVSSQLGNTETYQIHVYRLSNDTSLSDLLLSNINTSKKDDYTYEANIPYSTNKTIISIIPNNQNAFVEIDDLNWDLTNYGDNLNIKSAVVNAENCKEEYKNIQGNTCTNKTYTIEVKRESPSSNNYLNSLTVDGIIVPDFEKTKTSYVLENVVTTKNEISIDAIVDDTGKAKILSGTGNLSLKIGDNIFDIIVEAEDGTKKTYTIKVRRLSNNINLSDLTVSSNPQGILTPSFASSFYGTYSYTYDATVTSISVSATVEDTNNAMVSIADVSENQQTGVSRLNTTTENFGVDTNKVAITVTAEDGNIKVYYLNLSRTKSLDNTLSNLILTEKETGKNVTLSPNFKSSTFKYTATVEGNIENIDVEATKSDTYAKIISITGNTNLNFGLNTIEVIVEAENSVRTSYIINLTRKKYNIVTLDDLKADGISINNFNKDVYEYTIDNIPFDKDSIDISTVKTNELATVIGDGKVNLKTGNNEIIVKVIAHNGIDYKQYKINVYREKNNDNKVHELTIDGKQPTLNDDGTYSITLPNTKTNLTQQDVKIIASNDATITQDNNITLSTKNVNDYSFTIKAENGDSKNYIIHITREKSNDTSISKVTLTIGNDNSRYCIIDSNDSCKINVPVDTLNFSLDAQIHNEATISPINETKYDLPASESTKSIELTVTAEDNTSKVYTVNIERQKSSNNNLSDLKIDGVTIKDFNKNQQTYELIVDGNINDINVQATVEDTDKATITTDLSKPFNLDFDKRNQIEITVQAEDKTSKTYTVYITRSHRTDTTLKDLKINGIQIEGFTKTKEEYILSNLPYNTHQLNIDAIPNDDLAIEKGDGLISLNTGDNEIAITVTAHDTSIKKTYIIKVYRELNDDKGIKNISLAGNNATYNNTTGNYEVTVPNNVNIANQNNLNITVNDTIASYDKKATYSFNDTNLLTTSTNDIVIKVTAEDGSKKEHKLVVTREKSNIATLDNITVTNGSFNPSFNKDKEVYEVTVPVDTTQFKIDAVKTDQNATITSGIGNYTMTESSKQIEVVVVSEDLSTTKKYILNIIRTKSSINTLSDITVSNGKISPDFKSDITSYTVNVEGNVTFIDINATLTDNRATIESGIGNHELNVGNNLITIRVKSESGANLDYTVNVIRAQKKDNDLTSLSVDNVEVNGFEKDTLEYTLNNVPYSKTNINIDAILSDTDATVTGLGNKTLKTGLNTFEVKVKAQNGDEKIYKINITREKNNNAFLNILSVDGYALTPGFDSEQYNYEITVDYKKEALTANEVIAKPLDTNATVTKQDIITLSTTSDNYYKVVVTAENGQDTNTYVIKVNRPKSSDTSLKSVEVKGATLSPSFDSKKYNYIITVPYGQQEFTIQGLPNDEKTKVIGNGKYNITDNNISLTTTAESGATQTYNFTIVQALSNDATLNNLNVSGYALDKTFNKTELSYSIGNIPYGTTQLKINATANNSDSSIELYVEGKKQENNIINIPQEIGQKNITVKVIAPDNITTKSYVIDYNLVAGNNAYLSNITPNIGNIDFLKTTTYYEITIDNNITSISFDLTTEDSNAVITYNNEQSFATKKITVNDLKEGNNNISIKVTAQDKKTTKVYNILVKRSEKTASSDANLSNLSINGYSLDKVFSMEETEYSIGQIPFSLTELTINATPNMGTSKINYLVNGVKQQSNKVVIPKVEKDSAITIQVTAEDGKTIKNYKVKFTKQASTNAYLKDIIVSEGNLKFDKNTFSYIVDVNEDISSIDITAILDDNKATMKMNNVTYSSPHTLTITPLSSGGNEVTIYVTAENGDSLTYKVTINKNSNPESTITSIEYGHDIVNSYIKTVKVGTNGLDLKNQLDNENEYLEIWTADESKEVTDEEALCTGMIVKLMNDDVEKDRKYIVIKGDTSGDGEIDLFDAVKILNHYLSRNLLTGAYQEAAYVNDDTEIDLFDSVMILNHYLGKISLH